MKIGPVYLPSADDWLRDAFRGREEAWRFLPVAVKDWIEVSSSGASGPDSSEEELVEECDAAVTRPALSWRGPEAVRLLLVMVAGLQMPHAAKQSPDGG